MKKASPFFAAHWPQLIFVTGGMVLVAGLLLYRLGSLTGGLASSEQAVRAGLYGWHGLYHDPLFLPLNGLRSVVFWLRPEHGQTLTRLPDAIFGFLAILSMSVVLRLWHGTRTALFGGLLFATASWTLHASRLAGPEATYLWALPTLLLTHILLQRFKTSRAIVALCMLLWSLLLFIPGLVWLVVLSAYWLRRELRAAWRYCRPSWLRPLLFIPGLVWLPLLLTAFLHSGGLVRTWLGLPMHFVKPLILLKQLALVPGHLFIHGPPLPTLWLGRAPLLDVFTLLATLLGIYFYLRHIRASRSRLLFSCFIIAVVLIGLGGPVGFSLVVPLLFMWATAGIAYLLRYWLQVFPLNPLARGFGIGLVAVAVVVSCGYNLRAYFTAWPNDQVTAASFRSKH